MMQLRSVTRILNKHGISISTRHGKLAVKKASGGIPQPIKTLLRERENELIAWLKHREPIVNDVIAFSPTPLMQESPASCAQNRIWQAQHKADPCFTYNKLVYLPLPGDIKYDLLNLALNELLEKHDILRVTFKRRDGILNQHVHPPLSVQLPLHLISNKCDSIDRDVDRVMVGLGQTPFDLTKGPLLRVLLIQLPAPQTNTTHKSVQIETTDR
jgi:Condensation domain